MYKFDFRYRQLKEEGFVPKPSKKVNLFEHDGDGDIWKEAVTKVKQKNGKSKYRSYFYSCNTHERYWDEPPSGASTVIYANDVVKGSFRNQVTCKASRSLECSSARTKSIDSLNEDTI